MQNLSQVFVCKARLAEVLRRHCWSNECSCTIVWSVTCWNSQKAITCISCIVRMFYLWLHYIYMRKCWILATWKAFVNTNTIFNLNKVHYFDCFQIVNEWILVSIQGQMQRFWKGRGSSMSATMVGRQKKF